MSLRSDFIRDFGAPPEDLVIPADDIEHILTTGHCVHLLPSLKDCQPCLVGALFERQIALLAERVGCTPEDAAAIGASARAKQEAGL
jgi:hypothetical protein